MICTGFGHSIYLKVRVVEIKVKNRPVKAVSILLTRSLASLRRLVLTSELLLMLLSTLLLLAQLLYPPLLLRSPLLLLLTFKCLLVFRQELLPGQSGPAARQLLL